MTKAMTVAMLAVVAVLAIGASADAARIFYVDAFDPGADPNNTWKDWGPYGSHMGLSNTTYSDANDSYSFNGSSSGATGPTAVEDNFDFENNEAFSIVVYFKGNAGGAGTDPLVIKHEYDAVNLNRGYELSLSDEGGYQTMRASLNSDRAIRKHTHAFGDGQWHMVMWTVDAGDNTTAAHDVYADGSTTELSEFYGNEGTVSGTMLNSGPVQIGYELFSAGGAGSWFLGEIGIVEIWDEALPASYISTRWNSGSPDRVPEPATMALLGIGGLMVLRRRRSA